MTSRRILVTGVDSYWGGRLAQALERDPAVEAVIGVSPQDPACALERTEFVRVGLQHALLRRIVRAAEIDTVVDTRLIVDSAQAPARVRHEAAAVGTMNVLTACAAPGSPVRKVVFKSSAHFYGCERDDPAFFTEDMPRTRPPRYGVEADVVDAERAVEGFARRHPDVTVTVLRFANALGPDLRTSHTALLALPVVPVVLGFDPRYQFLHEDDLVDALRFATEHDLPGTYNAAADGVLALSEVLSLLGKRPAPVLPFWGTDLAARGLRAGGIRVPEEVLRQLRYGRGLDNRRLKGAGFRPRYTSREAVIEHAKALRTRGIERGRGEPYRYEREVEEFLRYSPSVRRLDRPSGTPDGLHA